MQLPHPVAHPFRRIHHRGRKTLQVAGRLADLKLAVRNDGQFLSVYVHQHWGNRHPAIRIAPGFDYFFKSDGIGLWSANVNGHYLFDIKGAEGLKIYPLFGFTLLGTTGSADAGDYNPGDYLPDGYGDLFDEIYDDALEEAGGGNETRFGCNLGAGIQYPIAESIDLGFEIKYQFVKDFDQIVFGINAAYKF